MVSSSQTKTKLADAIFPLLSGSSATPLPFGSFSDTVNLLGTIHHSLTPENVVPLSYSSPLKTKELRPSLKP